MRQKGSGQANNRQNLLSVIVDPIASVMEWMNGLTVEFDTKRKLSVDGWEVGGVGTHTVTIIEVGQGEQAIQPKLQTIWVPLHPHRSPRLP